MKTVCLLFLYCVKAQAANPEYFHSSYAESRNNFRQACAQAAESRDDVCLAHKIASKIDDDLTVDYGYFRRKGSRLIVIQSGIHGPEAFAGAAVQSLFMRQFLKGFLGRDIDVLLIHALNPYGFKHIRRTDEFNVNLNRNMVFEDGVGAEPNAAYGELRFMFEMEGEIKSVLGSSLLSHLRFLWIYAKTRFNKRYINQAMNSGQYEYPKGLNYGGAGPSQQRDFLRAILPPIFARYSGDILFLDFHTGLGSYGILQVMNGRSPAVDLFRRLQAWWSDLASQGVAFVNVNDMTDPNFYTVRGDVTDFVPKLAREPERVLALTMEYGTLGTGIVDQLRSASRMVLENSAHFHGCSAEAVCAEIEENFREMFNPASEAWRHNVIDEAEKIFAVLLEKF